MEERGLRRTSTGGVATRRTRLGHRILLKMRLRNKGNCPLFDKAHENYTWLKHYVEGMQESLSAYALQLARMTEAARGLGEDASHLYRVKDRGFKPVVAFKEAQDKGHNGYAGQLQQAFVKGIVEPVGEWHRDLESLEPLVTDFEEIRVQHDHYRLKVVDLTQKAKTLEERATTRGDSREAKNAAKKLKRNTAKLDEVTREFEKRLGSCCDRMTQAWEEREKMMNGIVARIIHFQESFFGEQLMNSLGVSRILSEAEGRGPRWGGGAGIEPFVPKGHVRHYEGELLRKHTLVKERLWYRLVGNNLEVYDVKTKVYEDDPLYVVAERPVAVYEVKAVAQISATNFRVTVLGGEAAGLNLFASDEADAEGWVAALKRASEWDQLSSTRKVESCVRESRAFLNRCKIAHANTTTTEGLEKELGVTEALANPPMPPRDRPDVKGYTVARAKSSGGDSAAGGGGGGGKAASSGGGSTAAAGLAPGGEAGITAAVAAAAGKWGDKAKSGKKQADDEEDEIPDLIKASEKKAGKSKGSRGGGGLPAGLTGGGGPLGSGGSDFGLGGLFPGRTGRPGMAGMMGGGIGAGTSSAGGVPLGMMGGGGGGGRMNPPSFSAAGSSFGGSSFGGSSFGGSTHSLPGGSQMGDPRLRMHQQQQMGMAPPPVNPVTGLPPGMRQNGPPVMLPPGMIPGSGPVVNPPVPPSAMDPTLMGAMGGTIRSWGGAQRPNGWQAGGIGGGGGGLPHAQSFGGAPSSRFGPKQGIRQQGFRRTSSFGDQNVGGAGGGWRRGGGGVAFDDMMYPSGRRLSTTREDDGFDEGQSTKSAPSFGATAAVGEAARAAAAATVAAERAAAGVHFDSKEDSSAEESKSSVRSKQKGGRGGVGDGGGTAAAKAAAAVTATAAALAAKASQRADTPSPAASPPRSPAAYVPVTIETVRPKKAVTVAASDVPPQPPASSAVSILAVESDGPPGHGGTTTTVTQVETASVTTPAPAPAAALAPTTTVAAASPARPAPASTVSASMAVLPPDPYLSDRGDDGGLSRYGTSGETPARVRRKPTPTWKRMMSLGSSTSGSSYRYDGGDMGISGEEKSSEEKMLESDRSKDAPGLKKTRSDRWQLRRNKSGSSADPQTAVSSASSSAKPRTAVTAAAAERTSYSSAPSGRRSASTGRGSRVSGRASSSAVRPVGASGASGASAAGGGGHIRRAKALSPSEDFSLDDDEFKRAPPITRDENAIGRSTRRVKTFQKQRPSAAGGGEAKAATKGVGRGVTAASNVAAAEATTTRQRSAAAIKKAGAASTTSAAAGAPPSSSSTVLAADGGDGGGGGGSKGQVEAPSTTVVAASDQAASGRSALVAAPSPINVPPPLVAESTAPAGNGRGDESFIATSAADTKSVVGSAAPAPAAAAAPALGGGASDGDSVFIATAPDVKTRANTPAGTAADTKGSTTIAAAAPGVKTSSPAAATKAAVEKGSGVDDPKASLESAKKEVEPVEKSIADAKASSIAATADVAAEKAKQSAAKYAEERKASAEAAKRVDNKTGIMKNLTLEEIMNRSSEADGKSGVTVVGTSTGDSGATGFDVMVPAVAVAPPAAAAAAAATSNAQNGAGASTGGADSATLSTADGLKTVTAENGGGASIGGSDSAALSTADGLNTGTAHNGGGASIGRSDSAALSAADGLKTGTAGSADTGSSLSTPKSNLATVGAPTPVIPAVEPWPAGAGSNLSSPQSTIATVGTPTLVKPAVEPQPATAVTAAGNSSVSSSPKSNVATVGDATRVVPATEPASVAGGCESITPAYFSALRAGTTAAAAAPTPAPGPAPAPAPAAAPEISPRTATKPAATAAAEATSQEESVAAAAAASDSPRSSNGGGGASASPPRTSLSAATGPASYVQVSSPDTPESTGSGAQIAAQAKVFQRLCDSSGSEAETGDAGGGVGGGVPGACGEERRLSFQQLMGWDEVQELVDYGALTEEELSTLWREAVSAQDVERGAGKGDHIWGGGGGDGRSSSTRDTLTQRGFMILVKLIEELQFEKELEEDKGVGLAPGRVCVV